MQRLLLTLGSLPVLSGLYAQLNGTYTVNPGGGGNYLTIQAALNDLLTLGVSGPVTISLADGVYDEDLDITPITGASAANTITFTSASANASAVSLTDQLIVTHADHIRFTYLTVNNGQTLNLGGHVNDVWVDHCAFVSDGGLYRTAIQDGGTDPQSGIHITNSTFDQFWKAIVMDRGGDGYSQIGLEIVGNTITSTVEHAEGIIAIGTEDMLIADNVIDLQAPVPADLYYSRAIHVYSAICPVTIAGNQIVHGTGGEGIMVNNTSGNLDCMVVVENNMVRLAGGHGFSPAVNLPDNSHVRCVHNTLRNDVDGYAMAVGGTTEYVTIEGNILSNTSGPVLFVAPGTTFLSDNNLFHGLGPTAVTSFNTALGTAANYGLASWQALGYDTGSLFADPLFVSATDLHIQPTSPAIGLAPLPVLVSTDIDGEPRPGGGNSTVEAGADELTVCVPMSGTYGVGPVPTAAFSSLNTAKDALYQCGVDGPVVFEIEDGTYTESLNFNGAIAGTSTTNTITFRSEALDSGAVVLRAPAGASALVRFSDADHVVFEHMTLDRSNGSGSQLISVISSGAPVSQGLTFRYLRLIGDGASSANNILVRSTSADAAGSVTFSNCTFENGYEGIKWTGASTEQLWILDCGFTGCTLDAIQVVGMGSGLLIEGNNILYSGTAQSKGLYLNGCNGAFKVTRNTFNANGAGSGSGKLIQLHNCAASANARPLVANNTLRAWDRTRWVGFYITGTTANVNMLHNSISLKNTNINGAALEVATTATGTGNRFSNNICYSRNSYAVYNPSAIAIGTLRNNLLYTTQANVSYWGSANADIAALQAASGQFNNSMEANPQYQAARTNLHLQTTSPAIAAGFLYNVVSDDHDSEARPLPAATNPDIGAYELDQSAPFAPRAAETTVQEDASQFRLFPNPANSTVQWIALPAAAERIELYDATGRSVRAVNAQDGILSVHDLPAGTYQALVIGNSAVLTSSRLVILH